MRISDWSSDVCSSDLGSRRARCRVPVRGNSAGPRRAISICQARFSPTTSPPDVKWFGGRAWAEFGAPAAYLQPCQKFRLSYYSLTLHSYAGSVFRSPAPDDVTAVPQKMSLGVLRSEEHTSELQSL